MHQHHRLCHHLQVVVTSGFAPREGACHLPSLTWHPGPCDDPACPASLSSRVLVMLLQHSPPSLAFGHPASCACWPPHTTAGGASADLLHGTVPYVALAQQSAVHGLQVLVVHLKRFLHTRTRREKIETPVDFPLEGLDLTPYLLHHQVGICRLPHVLWLTPRLQLS